MKGKGNGTRTTKQKGRNVSSERQQNREGANLFATIAIVPVGTAVAFVTVTPATEEPVPSATVVPEAITVDLPSAIAPLAVLSAVAVARATGGSTHTAAKKDDRADRNRKHICRSDRDHQDRSRHGHHQHRRP